jgi:hypothetical protein
LLVSQRNKTEVHELKRRKGRNVSSTKRFCFSDKGWKQFSVFWLKKICPVSLFPFLIPQSLDSVQDPVTHLVMKLLHKQLSL